MKAINPKVEAVSKWTWELLQSIIGWFVVIIYGAKKLKTVGNRGVYVSDKMPGGISLGAFIVINSRWKNDEVTIHHEWGHTRQSLLLGPLYLFVIGIPSILNAAFDFTKYYYDFYTEKWADREGGIVRKGTHHRYVSMGTYMNTGEELPINLQL